MHRCTLKGDNLNLGIRKCFDNAKGYFFLHSPLIFFFFFKKVKAALGGFMSFENLPQSWNCGRSDLLKYNSECIIGKTKVT